MHAHTETRVLETNSTADHVATYVVTVIIIIEVLFHLSTAGIMSSIFPINPS